ncbi:hypothetical protein CPL00368_CDS0069 [Klebsiella phage DevonBitter]
MAFFSLTKFEYHRGLIRPPQIVCTSHTLSG